MALKISKKRITRKTLEKIFRKHLNKKIISCKHLGQGIINTVYDIKTPKKEYIIRIAPEWHKAKFEREKWALEQCKKKKLPVPKVIFLDETEKIVSTPYIILEKLPGLTVVKEMHKNQDEKDDLIFQIGKLIAKMHKNKNKKIWKN